MKRALLLEDSKTCAAAATALLESLGYDVTHHDRSFNARAAAEWTRFDLYVLDVTAGDTRGPRWASGLVLAKWLRAKDPTVRIVIWSSSDHSADAAKLGAAFVRKGNMETLRKAIT